MAPLFAVATYVNSNKNIFINKVGSKKIKISKLKELKSCGKVMEYEKSVEMQQKFLNKALTNPTYKLKYIYVFNFEKEAIFYIIQLNNSFGNNKCCVILQVMCLK